jgi:hypothetical protein
MFYGWRRSASARGCAPSDVKRPARSTGSFLKSLFYPSRVSVPQVAAYECKAHPPRVALQEALFQRANMK